MPSSFFRQTTVVLLLSTLLTASLAAAGTRKAQPKAPTQAPIELLARAWSLLGSLWGEEGCNGDPNGRCVTGPVQPAPPQVHSDTGCNVDPNGRCVTPRVDTGCGVDPDGRCTP
jgi:hypothetical protein